MTVLVFFLAFAFFACGAAGTIPVYRDSGDLIASIHTLGIAHPPGYPVYVLLGHLFEALLPFGQPAYKANLFSALSAALACAFLYKSLRPFSRIGALSAAALLGATPAVMALARVPEMYSLALCWAVILWDLARRRTASAVMAAAFVLGLGMGVHPTLIFLAPIVIAAGIEARLSAREIGGAVGAFLLGCSVLLILPARAAQQPLQNWGDPSSWRGFWRVVTRADYGGLKLHPVESTWVWTPQSIAEQLGFFARMMMGGWGLGACLVACIGGAVAFYRSRRRMIAWGAALTALLCGPLFTLVSNLPIHEPTTPAILQPYLLLPGLFVAWGIARGFEFLTVAPAILKPGPNSLMIRLGPGLRIAGPTILGVLLLSVAPRSGWSLRDRDDFLAYDYGRNLLRALPPQAVLFDPDDPTSFTVRALQVTENRRTDIWPLNFFRTRWGYEQLQRRTDLLPPGPIDNAQELEQVLWTYTARRHPFYGELPQKLEGHPYAAEGLVYAANVADSAATRRLAEDNLERITRHDAAQSTAYDDFFARHLVSYYAAAHCNLGLAYANAGQLDQAIFHYKCALALDPTMVVAYNNWGTALYLQKHYAEAVQLYRAGLSLSSQDRGLLANLNLALARAVH